MLDDKMKEDILKIAKQEFLEQGFLGASTRNIAQKAGLTTGALYNRFMGKEELFEEIVGKSAKELLDLFMYSQEEFETFNYDMQIETMFAYTSEKVAHMLDIVYSDPDAFYLITTKSSGSRYEFYIDNMVELEVNSTAKFMEVLKSKGIKTVDMDLTLLHLLCTAMFNMFFEPIRHQMDKKTAENYLNTAFDFFNAGWAKLFGFK